MNTEDRIKLQEDIVFAVSGLALAALILTAAQAVLVNRVTKRYYAIRRAMGIVMRAEERMLQSENRDRQTKLELNMIDASRQNFNDQIQDLRREISKFPCTNESLDSSTFTDLPFPPTPEELHELDLAAKEEAALLGRGHRAALRASSWGRLMKSSLRRSHAKLVTVVTTDNAGDGEEGAPDPAPPSGDGRPYAGRIGAATTPPSPPKRGSSMPGVEGGSETGGQLTGTDCRADVKVRFEIEADNVNKNDRSVGGIINNA